MSSHIAIVESLLQAAAGNQPVVLATVVRVTGSSYGGVGARMVIRVDGSTVGLVSGGCLESDLCAHAVEVHATGVARVVAYDTRSDDDAVWGLGLGCNGLIDVLLQPLSPAEAGARADLLACALSAEEPSMIVTVTSASGQSSPAIGAQALLAAVHGKNVGDWGDGSALSAAREHTRAALAAGRRGMVARTGDVEVAFEVVSPAVRLVVCGSGPDAAPLCRLAHGLGWDVTLVDHRPVTDAHRARFPHTRIVDCADARSLAGAVPLSARTAAVVMSHHFGRDTDYLSALLEAGVAYIGVLGPRARTERMLAELAVRAERRLDGTQLFGPVGLDLGGDGPEAIALAIVAEVSAVMHDRTACHLREQGVFFHDTSARE